MAEMHRTATVKNELRGGIAPSDAALWLLPTDEFVQFNTHAEM
jgi:hypothetical protein